jgi:hypothetical protein
MKKTLILITFILALATSNLVSQTAQKYIEKDFLTYINHLIDREFTESVEYLYPELFDFVPKEQMIVTMEETFNNPEINISLNKPNIINVGEVRLIDSVYFCKLKYSHKMYMTFLDKNDSTSKEDKKLRDEMTLAGLQSTFGEQNVTLISDGETNMFDILSIKDSYAKSYDGLKEWKFIDIEKDNLMLLNILLPPQLVEEIQAEE